MDWQGWLAIIISMISFGLLLTTGIASELIMLSALAILFAFQVVDLGNLYSITTNSALWTILFLYVISSGLHNSGALGYFLNRIIKRPHSIRWAYGALFPPTSFLSGFINNTPLVAVLMPTVEQWCHNHHIPSSKFMLPISYCAVVGGLLTIIGTSTNLLAISHYELLTQRHQDFGLFTITPITAVIIFLTVGYIIWRFPTILPSYSIDTQPKDISDEEKATACPDYCPFRTKAMFFLIMAVLIGSSIFDIPIVIATGLGALGVIVMRIAPWRKVIEKSHLQVLLTLVGALGIGLALEKTNAALFIADLLVPSWATTSPLLMLLFCYIMVMVMTEFVTNNAAIVIGLPVILNMITPLGFDAKPFTIIAMIAASCSYLTPFGYQTNLMVYKAGHYRALDFVRYGCVPTLISMSCSVLLVWLYYF